VGKPLVRFQEGPENNGDMDAIMWHRRESRRQTENTNSILQLPEAPVYSNVSPADGDRPEFHAGLL